MEPDIECCAGAGCGPLAGDVLPFWTNLTGQRVVAENVSSFRKRALRRSRLMKTMNSHKNRGLHFWFQYPQMSTEIRLRSKLVSKFECQASLPRCGGGVINKAQPSNPGFVDAADKIVEACAEATSRQCGVEAFCSARAAVGFFCFKARTSADVKEEGDED